LERPLHQLWRREGDGSLSFVSLSLFPPAVKTGAFLVDANDGLVMASKREKVDDGMLISGVASLSTSLRSGDFGVSPPEEAKSSTSSFRGVENKGLLRMGDEKKCGCDAGSRRLGKVVLLGEPNTEKLPVLVVSL
jgi:hypothetical protein